MQEKATEIQNLITVILADDHPTTRAGIRAILNETPDIRVIGEAENGFQAQEMVEKHRPKILLLDLVMPGPTPAHLEKWVRTNFPETITLVLTAHDRDAYLASMIDAGASGFLSKTETGERLISAIRRAVSGVPLFTEEQFERALRWKQAAGEKWEILTNREREIIRLLAEGYDNKKIAKKLAIAPKTTAFHVTNILKKLDVKSRHEAIAWVNKYLPDNLE
ncbi:response regulator transcription factor [Chloroflexi bacterium CFX6]|nr:response regulator transcription factor [Chloroflexi bacterium CFX6]